MAAPSAKVMTFTYDCPKTGEERTVTLTKEEMKQSSSGLHADSECCQHCGCEQSLTYHDDDCPCGAERGHFVYIFSRQSG